MSEFFPSCCSVQRACFIHILRNGLKTGNINNRIHGNILPAAYDHDRDPCSIFIRKHTGAQRFASYHFSHCRKNVCEQILEHITYYQCAKYIGQEIRCAEKSFGADLTVQSQGKDQADHIRYDCCADRQLECKQIGSSRAGICEQIHVIPKADPIISSKAFKVGKTVNNTPNQRYRIEADKQCQDRYRY